MKYTYEQITAKGNPADVPYNVLSRAVRRDNRGVEFAPCHRCGVESRMNSVNRIDSYDKKGRPLADSYDNLRVVCREHDTERG
jgi:hypothetical protein